MNLTKVFTLVLAICTLTAQAQVVEKTEKKAKQKSEQRVDQKVDQSIDKGLDAIEGLFSKKKKKKKNLETEEESAKEYGSENETAAGAAMMKMMGSSDVQIQDEYKFDNRFLIHMESFDKKGKQSQSNEMTFLSKNESSVMGILMTQEGINTEMIYDLESFEIVTLMNTGGQKMGTTMAIDKSKMEDMMKEEEAEQRDMSKMPTFKKTGETKTISGYSCDEYLVENIENEDGSVTYWITDELDVDWIKSMSNMSNMNKQMPDMYASTGYPENGSVIQMVMTEEKGEKTVMTVKEVETNQNITISTKGYTFMNMSGR